MIKLSKALRIVGVLTGLTLSISGCGAFHQEDFPKDGPKFKATSNPMTITDNDLGDSWPFDDLHSVTVSCKHDGDDVVLRLQTPDGQEYALNGVKANSQLQPVEDIANGSIGTIRSAAFGTCDFPS